MKWLSKKLDKIVKYIVLDIILSKTYGKAGFER